MQQSNFALTSDYNIMVKYYPAFYVIGD